MPELTNSFLRENRLKAMTHDTTLEEYRETKSIKASAEILGHSARGMWRKRHP